MEVLKIFDAYSLRARLFPAIIAAAPALAALTLLISWRSDLSNAIATIASLVLLFAIADLARARAVLLSELYQAWRDAVDYDVAKRSDVDSGSKERTAFLAAKLGCQPSLMKRGEPNSADAFYEQCGVWLRQNTRDTNKFSVLFAENVTYGFRRNLLGVKRLALGLNLLVVGICVVLLWRTSWAIEAEQGKRVAVVLIVAAAHAAYMLLAVRKSAVWDAAKAYGRELILSCEAFLVASGVAEKT